MRAADSRTGVRCVVFDFDGVLVDSNRRKHEAYFELFPDIPDSGAHVAAALRSKSDGDRFDVIAEILAVAARSGWTPGGDPDSLVREYAARYNEICEEHASVCGEVRGASRVVAELGSRLPLYINSATPLESLERIVERRGWRRYFAGVLGRPASKLENFLRILRDEGLTAAECVFVGDRQSDWEVAQAVGCAFVAVRDASSDFHGNPELALDDLARLPDLVDELGRGTRPAAAKTTARG